MQCFTGMNRTFEIVFACKKGAATARNLMQALKLCPTLLESTPERPEETQ